MKHFALFLDAWELVELKLSRASNDEAFFIFWIYQILISEFHLDILTWVFRLISVILSVLAGLLLSPHFILEEGLHTQQTLVAGLRIGRGPVRVPVTFINKEDMFHEETAFTIRWK